MACLDALYPRAWLDAGPINFLMRTRSLLCCISGVSTLKAALAALGRRFVCRLRLNDACLVLQFAQRDSSPSGDMIIRQALSTHLLFASVASMLDALKSSMANTGQCSTWLSQRRHCVGRKKPSAVSVLSGNLHFDWVCAFVFTRGATYVTTWIHKFHVLALVRRPIVKSMKNRILMLSL